MLIGSRTLGTLKNNKRFEGSTEQEFCFRAPALSLVLATLGEESAPYLQMERPAMSREDVVGLS